MNISSVTSGHSREMETQQGLKQVNFCSGVQASALNSQSWVNNESFIQELSACFLHWIVLASSSLFFSQLMCVMKYQL